VSKPVVVVASPALGKRKREDGDESGRAVAEAAA